MNEVQLVIEIDLTMITTKEFLEITSLLNDVLTEIKELYGECYRVRIERSP